MRPLVLLLAHVVATAGVPAAKPNLLLPFPDQVRLLA